MHQYLDMLGWISVNGDPETQTIDGDTVPSLSAIGQQMRLDLTKGLPVVTTRRIDLKSVVDEVLFGLSGEESKGAVPSEWRVDHPPFGSSYGQNWRRLPTQSGEWRDQIANLLARQRDASENVVVTGWNPIQVIAGVRPTQHLMWQVITLRDRLHVHCTLRSIDVFRELPYYTAFYGLLTNMLGHVLERPVGQLVVTLSHAYVRVGDLTAIKVQLSREPYNLPVLSLRRSNKSHPSMRLDAFTADDVIIDAYRAHPKIRVDP